MSLREEDLMRLSIAAQGRNSRGGLLHKLMH
jgi:hypothetical protein